MGRRGTRFPSSLAAASMGGPGGRSRKPEDLTQSDWMLRDFGAGPVIVTKSGGSRVVLSGGQYGLKVRDAGGRLSPATEDHHVIKAVLAIPGQMRVLRSMVEEIQETRDALVAAITNAEGEIAHEEDRGHVDRLDRLLKMGREALVEVGS